MEYKINYQSELDILDTTEVQAKMKKMLKSIIKGEFKSKSKIGKSLKQSEQGQKSA